MTHKPTQLFRFLLNTFIIGLYGFMAFRFSFLLRAGISINVASETVWQLRIILIVYSVMVAALIFDALLATISDTISGLGVFSSILSMLQVITSLPLVDVLLSLVFQNKDMMSAYGYALYMETYMLVLIIVICISLMVKLSYEFELAGSLLRKEAPVLDTEEISE